MTRVFTLLHVSVGLLLGTHSSWATQDGMPRMPQLQPKKSYTVPSPEAGHALLEQRGFGDLEPQVQMMNLMMVEGSGMEGMSMDMGDMKKGDPSNHAAAATPGPKVPSQATENYAFTVHLTPSPPQVGRSLLEVSVLNKAGKPVTGLKLSAKVYMTSMDMGTEEPGVQEVAPGKYRVKVAFAMKGPWAVEISTPEGEKKVFNFETGPTAH